MSKPIQIKSILGGHSESYYIGSPNTFLSSIAIDPDQAIPGQTKASGAIVPVGYSSFATPTGYLKWILTNPKNNSVYVYTTDNFLKYDSTLTIETIIGNPTGGAGNGAAYYNDYIYLATATGISRYGLLSGSPSLGSVNFIAAMTNTTYPSLNGTPIPNHPMFVLADTTVSGSSLYVGDVVNGVGAIHRISTTVAGVNDDSAFQVLSAIPNGFYPTCMSNYGLDLVIGMIQTSSDIIVSQGNACLIFWEVSNPDGFYRMIPLQDPLVTAMKNINGTLYIWSGNANGGTRLSKYLGGDVLQQVAYHPESLPPLQGAVDAIGNKLVWGGTQDGVPSVFSHGSFNNFPMGLHNIARATTSDGAVTALKITNQSGRMAIGSGSTTKSLDKYSASATLNSVWKSQVFTIGSTFTVDKIRLQLGRAVSANTIITPALYVDDGSANASLRTINSTNYTASQRTITLGGGGGSLIKGNNNFYLQFTFTGTEALPITLPITIDLTIFKP